MPELNYYEKTRNVPAKALRRKERLGMILDPELIVFLCALCELCE
jgi:hypothetical protein